MNTDPVETVRREDPLKIKYVRMLRMFLGSIGAWPGEAFGEKVPLFFLFLRKYLVVETSISLFCLLYFMITNSKTVSFFTLGHCCISFCMTALTAIRVILPNLKAYGVLVHRFFRTFHLVHFRHKGDHYEKMYVLVNKISYYCALCVIISMFVGETLFNLSPIYQSYRVGAFTGKQQENSTATFSVYWSFPGFNPYDWFLSVTMINFVLTHIVSVSFCSIDLLLYIMVFQIIGHIQLLNESLDLLPKPTKQIIMEEYKEYGLKKGLIVELYDHEENDYIRKQLAENVDLHVQIISFTGDMSTFFGLMMAVNYMFHLVCCGILLLECAQADLELLVTFAPLTIITFGQLGQFSLIFEYVHTVSAKLKDKIYCVPWECMDTGNRRATCIILRRMQTPITVTVLGMASVGVTTMASILKTTLSYFLFLQTFNT